MRRMRGGMRAWDMRSSCDWEGLGLWCMMMDRMARFGVTGLEIGLICLIC